MTNIDSLASRLWQNTQPQTTEVTHKVRGYYSGVADARRLECNCGWCRVVSSYDFKTSAEERAHVLALIEEHERGVVKRQAGNHNV